MESGFDHRPSFFKIMKGDLNSEKLEIPPHFVMHISKDLADRVALRDPSGRYWIVKQNVSEGKIYLQDGWPEFVRHHSLGDNEFLIFNYDGDMCFEVQIFGKDGLEKTKNAISRQQPQSVLPNGKRPRGRPRKNGIQKRIGTDEIEQPVPEMVAGCKHGGAEVLGKDEFFTSTNPCFRACIRKSAMAITSRHQVIPVHFSRTHFPEHNMEVVLKNLKGESWEVKSCFTAGKHSMCAGWGAFALDNNLKVGDVCIFELVAKYEMLVRISSVILSERGQVSSA